MRHTLFKPIFFLLILSLLTSNIVLAQEAKGKILDMTYAFGDDSIYWPTGKSFKSEKMFRGINDKGWWYASNDYSANEHGGTHADARFILLKMARPWIKFPWKNGSVRQ